MHDASALQSIDPDRSWRIRMSGGSGAAPWFTAAQFESRVDIGVASIRGAASMVGIVIVPACPPAAAPPASESPTPPTPAPPVPCRSYVPGWWYWQPGGAAPAPTPLPGPK